MSQGIFGIGIFGIIDFIIRIDSPNDLTDKMGAFLCLCALLFQPALFLLCQEKKSGFAYYSCLS